MNVTVFPAAQRFHTDAGWLDSRHTFSFGGHFDPSRLGFRNLRVVNDDRIEGGKGFGAHPHRDMEIVSWVVEGGLAHRDSMGSGSVIRPGDAQRMTAGTGVRHSEQNAEASASTHFFQLWLLPSKPGLAPEYEQKHFSPEARSGRLTLLAAPDGRDGALKLNADAELRTGLLPKGTQVVHVPQGRQHAFVQVVKGAVALDGRRLNAGDGAALEAVERFGLEALEDSEVLVFDLA